MRVDLLLKNLCLAKSRSQAKRLCEKGLVVINGRVARPAAEAAAGDRIELDLGGRRLGLELLALPEKQASRVDAPRFYKILFDAREEEKGF